MTGHQDLVQLITPAGERVHGSAFDSWVEDVDTNQLRQLYEQLVVVRRIDAEATALQRQGELGLWAPFLGQEAAQVGSAEALREDDFVFPSFREYAVAYCQGVDPAQMLQVWRGTAHSSWNPYDFGIMTPAVVVGSQALHATGYALGCQLDGSDTATIAYIGDGATSQGDVSEALVFAATYQAPVVFFCQNNQWAISEPVRVQARGALATRASGFDIPAVQVDGNDVLAVLAVTRWAMQRARDGDGPTFIEASTYRLGPHTTSDDPNRYRTSAEIDEWKGKDPLDRVRLLLRNEGALEPAAVQQIQLTADKVAATLRKGCIETADPMPLSLFDTVYAAPHPHVDEERIEFASYLAGFEGED